MTTNFTKLNKVLGHIIEHSYPHSQRPILRYMDTESLSCYAQDALPETQRKCGAGIYRIKRITMYGSPKLILDAQFFTCDDQYSTVSDYNMEEFLNFIKEQEQKQ